MITIIIEITMMNTLYQWQQQLSVISAQVQYSAHMDFLHGWAKAPSTGGLEQKDTSNDNERRSPIGLHCYMQMNVRHSKVNVFLIITLNLRATVAFSHWNNLSTAAALYSSTSNSFTVPFQLLQSIILHPTSSYYWSAFQQILQVKWMRQKEAERISFGLWLSWSHRKLKTILIQRSVNPKASNGHLYQLTTEPWLKKIDKFKSFITIRTNLKFFISPEKLSQKICDHLNLEMIACVPNASLFWSKKKWSYYNTCNMPTSIYHRQNPIFIYLRFFNRLLRHFRVQLISFINLKWKWVHH